MIYASPQVSDRNSVTIYKDKQTRTRTQSKEVGCAQNHSHVKSQYSMFDTCQYEIAAKIQKQIVDPTESQVFLRFLFEPFPFIKKRK